jgi:uncharacterized protein
MISVPGHGRAAAPPDLMRARVTASAQRPTVAEALAASEAAANRIRTTLRAAGVDPGDLATAGLSVNPEQVWHEATGPRITGYRADHEIDVSLRDLAAAGQALGQALAAGGDDARLGWVSFAVRDEGPLRTAARDLAWADALRRATQLAGLAGRRLGEVAGIAEEVSQHGPVIPGARQSAHAVLDAAVSVEPAAVEVVVCLTVSWQFG